MLLGEHAVVYGHPSLVTAVDLRISARAERLDQDQIIVESSLLDRPHDYPLAIALDADLKEVPKGISFVLATIQVLFAEFSLSAGLKITTAGPKISYGLGSSSAVTVATTKAIDALFDLNLTKKQIFQYSYQAVLDVQGAASGFDVAAAAYGGTLYYAGNGETIRPLQLDTLPVVIGYSGSKVGTVSLVAQVAELREQFPEFVAQAFDMIRDLVGRAEVAINNGDWALLGQLLNLNQGLLDSLGVNSQQLAQLIYASREVGVFGAKLSGAGGGDCMFAVVSDSHTQAVIEAIEAAGGQHVDLPLQAEGARIDDVG